jgi:hypothetical protein
VVSWNPKIWGSYQLLLYDSAGASPVRGAVFSQDCHLLLCTFDLVGDDWLTRVIGKLARVEYLMVIATLCLRIQELVGMDRDVNQKTAPGKASHL